MIGDWGIGATLGGLVVSEPDPRVSKTLGVLAGGYGYSVIPYLADSYGY